MISKRILLLTNQLPYPVVSGETLRVYSLLQRIAPRHEIRLASLSATAEQREAISHLTDLCREVAVLGADGTAQDSPLAHPGQALHFLAAGIPIDLRYRYSADLAEKLRGFADASPSDIAHIEFSNLGLYLDSLPETLRRHSIWMLHDIDWTKYERIARLERKPSRKIRLWLQCGMMRRWKPRFAQKFSRVITVSESDRRLLLGANPRLRVEVVPNGVDTHIYRPLPEEDDSHALIFVGNMDYTPCADAMVMFHREILPIVRNALPDVSVWIVGIRPRPEVRALAGDGVHVTGRVDDVRPYYARSAVSIVPLRAGGGTRLKILESMALGRPVVSTAIGCEGLEVTDGEHLFVADRPEDFAERIVRLLRDRDLRIRVARSARELVTRKYDWDPIAQELERVYAEVGE